MTAYRITPATSVYTNVPGDDAFDSDGPGADSLTVDADAFLVAAGGFASDGARLANTGAWTVNVNGSIASPYDAGLRLDPYNPGVSTITVGGEGSIGGKYGMFVNSAANIQNAGTISGNSGYAMYLDGTGAHAITNTGIIEGGIYGANDRPNTDSLTNSGTISGGVSLGAGGDTITNYATVGGIVVSGTVGGTIDLGDGNDRFRGGANAETVQDNNGHDNVALGGGDDTYVGTGASGVDGFDVIDGGTGLDTYDASTSPSAVEINLDAVAHDLAPFAPGAFRVAARTVDGDDVVEAASDTVTGFENVRGGSGADIIYGSSGANAIEGNGGSDFLFGHGGNDVVSGGASFDYLIGGAGRDRLSGGTGADTFLFTSKTDSGTTAATRDVILDFQDSQDVIALDWIDAKANTAANDAFTFIGTDVAFRGAAGELRAYHTATGLRVQGDLDGNGRADFSIDVRDATHVIGLTEADFAL